MAKVQSRFARKINDWGRRQRKAMKARRAQGNMKARRAQGNMNVSLSRGAAAAAQQQSLGDRSVQRPGTAGLATSTISQRSQSGRGKRTRQALFNPAVEGSAHDERDGDVIMERDEHAGANPRKRRAPRHPIAGAAGTVATSTPRMAAAANPTIAGPGTVVPATPRATRASASTTTASARTPTPVPTDTGPIAVPPGWRGAGHFLKATSLCKIYSDLTGFGNLYRREKEGHCARWRNGAGGGISPRIWVEQGTCVENLDRVSERPQ